MTNLRKPAAAALAAWILAAPAVDAFAAAGRRGPTVEPPAAPAVPSLPSLPVLTTPQTPAGVPAAPAALPVAKEGVAYATVQLGRRTGEVIPLTQAAADPAASPAEAAGTGQALETAMTGVKTAVPTVFTAMPGAEKAGYLERYGAYLQARNGTPDTANRRLSVRERFFEAITADPVRREGAPAVDQAVFSRNETRNKPEAGLDQRTLWALAVAKSNRTEKEGVEYGVKHVDHAKRAPGDPMTSIEIEEFYHTRLLQNALEVVGLRMRMLPPHPVTKLMVHLMARLPKPIAYVMIHCGEVVGVTVFRLLKEKAAELFADQPASRARLEALFSQIVVDEVGHVHYARSHLGPARLWLARKLMPIFTRYFLSDIPELTLLFGKKRLMSEILKADVDGAAAPYPDRFVPFPAK